MKKPINLFFLILFLFLSFTKTYADFHQEWVNNLYVSHNYISSPSILIDQNGNSYVLSVSDSTNNSHLVIKLTKYQPNGIQSWSSTYDNPQNTYQEPISFLVTSNSDIFILGQALISTNSDYLVLKYNSSGTIQWAKQYDSPGYDVPTAFTIDNSGNIFVTGTSHFNGTNQIVTNTIKISPSGNLLWHKSITAISDIYITGGIITDFTGNIYLQYYFANFETGLLHLMKYNSNGDSLWDRTVDTLMQTVFYFCGMKRDSSNNIYYAIQIDGNYYWSLKISKFDINGSHLSTYNYYTGVYGSTVSLGDYKIMNNYNVIISGTYKNTPSAKSQLLFLMYNPTGNLLKTIRTSYNSNFDCSGSALAMDQNSNIFVCGQANISTNNGNYITIKYNSLGDSQYCIIYSDPVNNDGATGIAADTNGNVYVTGMSMNANYNYTALTIKYSQLMGIEKISSSVPNKFALFQNYPNPFNPITKIKYQIPKTSFVKLIIYDVLGKEIRTLVNEKLQLGTYEVDFDGSNYPSGVYFYKLSLSDPETSSGLNFEETRRMVLIK